MDSIRLTYDLPVPQPAAYYLFVEEMSLWWPGVHTHDPAHFRGITIASHPGGPVTSHFDDHDVIWGQVLAAKPPFSITWNQWWRQSAEFPSSVTLRFVGIETGSRLQFEHGGWTRFNIHTRQRFFEWPLILSNYVAHTRAHARGRTLAPRAIRGVA